MKASDYILEFARLADEEIPLFQAGLGISLIEYSDLRPEDELQKLESLVEAVRGRINSQHTPDEKFQILTHYYFKDLDFRGNDKSYYDPNNSFLNEVLERAVGIPITISVIFIEIAKRLGLNAYGINFPGHFLIGYQSSQGTIYLDPFNRGTQCDRHELQNILDQLYQDNTTFQESFLAPATSRNILVRMLYNLQAIYSDQHNYGSLLEVLNCLCVLLPESGQEFRNRGLLHMHLENYHLALKDFVRYTELSDIIDEKTEKLIQLMKDKMS